MLGHDFTVEWRELGGLGRWVGGGTPSKTKPAYWTDGTIPWISPKDMKSKWLSSSMDKITECAVRESSTSLVPSGSLLLVLRSGILSHTLPVCRTLVEVAINQDLKALIPDPSCCVSYLSYAIQNFTNEILASCWKSGTTVCSLDFTALKSFKIPVPPLEEQRRIAAILDSADALREKRRQALALVEQLTQSVFREMFDSTACRSVEFQSLVKEVRNGVSPSTTGLHLSTVLTLSAVTQGSFDSSQRKEGTFDKVPPVGQTVRGGDLLICRGNGNRDLVGRGVVPRESHHGLVFPDTVIAVTPKEEVASLYLETVWNLPSTRSQIVSRASTTNGTFKVNQKSLGQVIIPLPPLELQQEFARRVEAIEKLKSAHQQSLKEMDALFASLQHRAFRGEL